MHRTTTAIVLAIAVLSVFSLATGTAQLGYLLPGGLPLGNALAALALCAAAGAAVRIGAPGTVRKRVSKVTFIAALAWLPVSIALAGNLALNYSGWRGSAWLAFSLAVLLAVVFTLAWALVASLLALLKRAGASR